MTTQEILAKLNSTVTYCGEGKEKDWQFDRWNVSIVTKKETFSFEYKTGVGLRKNWYDRNGMQTPKNWEDLILGQAKGEKKPVSPTIEDIFYSILLDSEAGEYNFEDWADTFGFSSDSIEALNIYKACLVHYKMVRALFTKEEVDTMKEFYVNY